MGLDALAKRGYPAVTGALIATAAYFQASGISQLLGRTMVERGNPAPVALLAAASAPAVAARSASAAPILSRNPFDSATGPLDASRGGERDLAESDPRADALCETGRVVLIAKSDDPDWSFAAIEGDEGRTELLRLGGEIQKRKVVEIAWDHVWLTAGGARCQMLLGKSGARSAEGARARPEEPAREEPRVVSRPKSSVPQEIASRIRRTNESEIEIDRSAVDQILAQSDLVTHTSAAGPDVRGDQVVGMKFKIKPGSVLESIGLQNDDTVRSLNGVDLTSPENAMEAYRHIQSDHRLSVLVERGGRLMRLRINVNSP